MSGKRLKLCVIDDIKSVADMITTRIPWEEHGIETAGSALDGDEGLELVLREKPDIVLSDIRMPRMDGLEMTRRILEALPHCKVIILSAYTDFAYAQQAIRLGAFDFVKKPFSVKEIADIVLKARDARLEEMQEQAHVQAMEQKMRDSLPVLRQEYFHLLMHHSTDIPRAAARWEFLQLELVPRDFAVLIAEIDHLTEKFRDMPVQEMELVRFSLQNIMEETVARFTKGIIFRESMNRYVVVINCRDDAEALAVAEACCVNIATYTKFTISIGTGLYAAGVDELPRSYNQALKALSYHFYTGGNGALGFGALTLEREPVPEAFFSREQELLFALRSGNKDKCIPLLEGMLDSLTGELGVLPAPEYVETLCCELASKLYRVLLELFPQDQLTTFETRLGVIKSAGPVSFQRLRELLLEFTREGCERVEGSRRLESRRIILEAMAYIRSHLQLDLSLEHCARQFNFSPGYFSNLFKKESGMSFQHFVIQEKMEKAKAMLLSDHQVQEIARDLGYEHRRYFSEVFKKYTGQTPSEFRDANL